MNNFYTQNVRLRLNSPISTSLRVSKPEVASSLRVRACICTSVSVRSPKAQQIHQRKIFVIVCLNLCSGLGLFFVPMYPKPWSALSLSHSAATHNKNAGILFIFLDDCHQCIHTCTHTENYYTIIYITPSLLPPLCTFRHLHPFSPCTPFVLPQRGRRADDRRNIRIVRH